MVKLGKGKISRNPLETVESLGFGKGLKFKRMKGERFWENWSTEKYGQYKAAMGKQIGGQSPQMGPDILKFIKKHDPDNSSGSVKDALDIMQKLQDNSTKKKDLFSSIQPLQSILGGGLYGKMQAAGAAAKSSEKVREEKPDKDMLAELIAAAMECTGGEDAALAAELLDDIEISRIDVALDSGGTYTPANPLMPQKFVDCVNNLIPSFYAIQEGTTV